MLETLLVSNTALLTLLLSSSSSGENVIRDLRFRLPSTTCIGLPLGSAGISESGVWRAGWKVNA